MRTGKVYYEATLSMPGQRPQLGWAVAAKFVPADGVGVGDDALSWACDGVRGALRHGGQSRAWSDRWTAGDVIGCAADLEAGSLWFGLNGEWTEAADFTGCDFRAGGLFPAFSGCNLLIELHLGDELMLYNGPDESFQPLLSHPLVRGFTEEEAPFPRLLDPNPKPAAFHTEREALGERWRSGARSERMVVNL